MGNNGDYDIEQVKHGVEKHLNVCTLYFFLNLIDSVEPLLTHLIIYENKNILLNSTVSPFVFCLLDL